MLNFGDHRLVQLDIVWAKNLPKYLDSCELGEHTHILMFFHPPSGPIELVAARSDSANNWYYDKDTSLEISGQLAASYVSELLQERFDVDIMTSARDLQTDSRSNIHNPPDESPYPGLYL